MVAAAVFVLPAIAEETDTNSPINADFNVEFGFGSSEQTYYKPYFRIERPLSFGTIFTEFSYYQVQGGKLQDRIDYWINIGMVKNFTPKLAAEFRLNHMCRHLPSTYNPRVLVFNEVMAKLWLLDDHFKLAAGIGTYTGGSADYKKLLQLDGEFPHVFGSGFSLSCQFKWVDFDELLHEAEVSFSLGKNTELFVRNIRHYELKNSSYAGIRLKSMGEGESYIDSMQIGVDIFPSYKPHKISVDGVFRLVFLQKPQWRVLMSIRFIAPVLRGEKFFSTFFPEEMIYPVFLMYQHKLNDSLFINLYGNYHTNMPMDVEKELKSSWAAGAGVRNQWDFERMEKRFRYDLFAGYNFEDHFEAGGKLGYSFLKMDGLNIGTHAGIEYSRERLTTRFLLFLDYGKDATFRPFIGYERYDYKDSSIEAVKRFILGFNFFRWFN